MRDYQPLIDALAYLIKAIPVLIAGYLLFIKKII